VSAWSGPPARQYWPREWTAAMIGDSIRGGGRDWTIARLAPDTPTGGLWVQLAPAGMGAPMSMLIPAPSKTVELGEGPGWGEHAAASDEAMLWAVRAVTQRLEATIQR
jgi:hypothetical protein